MTPDRYASVPERITWTSGFRLPIDKHVLGVLSTFANFRTGACAMMRLETLARRAGVHQRTVMRALRRLEAGGWIRAHRRHRASTVYEICLDRLATDWRTLNDTAVTQKSLSDTAVTQDGGLSDTGVTQDGGLSDTGVTRSPVRTDPLYKDDPHALRAGFSPKAEQQLTFGPTVALTPTPDPKTARRFVEQARESIRKAQAKVAEPRRRHRR